MIPLAEEIRHLVAAMTYSVECLLTRHRLRTARRRLRTTPLAIRQQRLLGEVRRLATPMQRRDRVVIRAATVGGPRPVNGRP